MTTVLLNHIVNYLELHSKYLSRRIPEDQILINMITNVPLGDLYNSDEFWRQLRVRIEQLRNKDEVYKYREIVPIPI